MTSAHASVRCSILVFTDIRESWKIVAVSHFAPILFTKRSKGYNLLGRVHDRSKSKFGVVFLQTTTFSQSVFFFFQHSSVQLLKRTNEIEKQILELWADSERRTANNMVSKTTFHVRQATSMVVGWTAESGCQESTVKPVKQGGQSP